MVTDRRAKGAVAAVVAVSAVVAAAEGAVVVRAGAAERRPDNQVPRIRSG